MSRQMGWKISRQMGWKISRQMGWKISRQMGSCFRHWDTLAGFHRVLLGMF